ncbi:MAG: radical SAM protein [Myxococcales bacterium]|nr:radical SAM protein [Myxococcales bacterium]MCB9643984.1 radical SAM protein [Myxococcales bacterium]
MPQRSRVSSRFFMKQLIQAARKDFRTSYSLARYQFAKETFNVRHFFKPKNGMGDELQLIGIRITDMCNLRCHTCGQWGDNGYLVGKSLKELKSREVPLDVYKRMVDEVVEAGWSPIWYFWGGEPMLYPGIIELLHYIKDRGMAISLVSNGTNIAKYADDIIETCKILHISVDGPNEEIHNTQRPGVAKTHNNFKSVQEALEVLSAKKKERDLFYPYIVPISCITCYNIDVVADLYKFVAQYADAHMFYLTWWIDAESANEHTEDFKRRFGFEPQTHYGWIGSWKDFDQGMIFDKYQELIQISESNGGKCPPMIMPELNSREDIKRYYSDHKSTFGYNQCVSIFMTLELDSNGDASFCRDYHDYIIGNIKESSVKELWNNEKARKFRSSISQDGPMPVCRRCCGLMGF